MLTSGASQPGTSISVPFFRVTGVASQKMPRRDEIIRDRFSIDSKDQSASFAQVEGRQVDGDIRLRYA